MNTKLSYLPWAVALVLAQTAYAKTDKTPAPQVHTVVLPHMVFDEMNVRLVVPTHVQTLNREALKESAAQNIEDIAMYEPEVGVRSDNLQLGHQNFSIRGMDGNRILMTIDGIPLPDEQSDLSRGGTFTPVVSRDNVETDTLKNVQIVKGANGTAQGDGAVGGSVNMRTYSATDLVSDDKPLHFGIKYGYRSTYRSHGTTATAAMKQGIFSTLAMLTYRNQHEAENYPAENDSETGAKRTESNEQDITQKNVLLKAGIDGGEHRIEATLERFMRDVKTQRFDKHRNTTGTDRATGIRYHTDKVEKAYDEYIRRRYSIDYQYAPTQGVFDKMSVRLYSQKLTTQTDSHSVDLRTPVAGGNTIHYVITTDGGYNQKIRGIRPELYKTIDTATAKHNVLFGAEYRQTKTDRLTTQLVTETGKPDQNNRGAYFPPADRKVASLYVQDNVEFNNGATLGLGLRYENEKTKFDFSNEHYSTTTEGRPVAFSALKNKIILPSLGVSYPITNNLTGSFAYRRGYRSPDVNFAGSGFSNSRFGYRVIPNPNLKPEASDNYELGLSFSDEKLKASTSVFYSRYKDFINSYSETKNVTPPYKLEMYYYNVDRARAYGAEVKLAYKLTDHLQASGAVAWIDSKNKSTDQPLATSYPINGVLGLDYAHELWDIGAKIRMARKNTDVPTVDGAKLFQAPGYAVLDVTASYRPTKNIEITAGVYNVANKKYWLSADTKGVYDNAQKDRYTQPGRNFAVSAELKF